MMRKIMALSLLAASLVPATTMAATSRGELARDRQGIRDDRRDLRHAYRYGDSRDISDARDDYRDSRREYREDWRDYRRQRPHVYQRGNWHAPFRYSAFHAGSRLDRGYYGSRYVIANPSYYHLPRVHGSQRWIRHYDDVLLVDIRTGRVRDVIRGFFR